ncbi:MAG TPA: ABC transporter permease [Candidatus Acidoferrales bacterium]|nr:ABC transporter permease [Candidatus Acidoferrales bacterium]
MAAILQDLRYSLRTLRKSPVFLAVAVLSLALGIGANTAIFTLINQLILQPLPVKNPEQLVMLAGRGKHYGGNNGPDRLSYPMYREIRDKNQVFSGMFCTYPGTVSASFQGGTELIGADFVSGNYFPVLGIGAAAGRVFTASDDLIQGGHPLAVLSYGYWRGRFGADRGIVGKQIVVNGRGLTIIGVSPAGFDGVEPGRAPQIRIPMTMRDSLPNTGFSRLNEDRFRWTEVFGRLKPGMTMEKAQAGLQPLFHQILNREVTEKPFAKASPFVKQEFLKMWMEVMPGSKGRSNLRRVYSKPLFALMGIVGLVLLIACSNLANLLIARASARQKEIAVRLALGAGRGRLVRQLLMESLVLAAVGGSLGVGLAVTIDRALIDFLPSGHTPLSLSSTPDWTVLGFTFAISLLAGGIFGLVPALQSTRPKLANTLKDEAGGVVRGGSAGLRKGLVVAQVSLSLLLLIGAGLFLQSLRNLKTLNPGFEVKNLLAFDVDPTMSRYDPKWSTDYYRRLHERLTALPGVESHTFAVVPLLEDNEWDSWVTIEGYSAKQDERPDPHMQYCSPGFFKTLKIPVLLGRDFNERDVAGAPKVGIVNQKFVKRYLGGADPIGRHIGMGIDPGTKLDIQIVGVVGDTKYESMRDEIPFELYIPSEQTNFANGGTVYVRAQGDPTQLFNTLRTAVRGVDAGVPMYDMRTLEGQMEISLLTERLLATLSSVFGCLATLLAALGLYGVMAFMVARRTREIGIRMALGAGQGSVVWMVLSETLTLAGIGVALGLAGAYGVTRLIQAQLFGVKPTDLLTMAAASVGIAAVTALAGYIPARRATGIDPMSALRWE